MSAKTVIDVVIDGKVYKMSGYEDAQYLQKVAAFINGKIKEVNSLQGANRLGQNIKYTMVELNIADDYFKEKAQVEKLEREIEQKDKEIYDLKHELISGELKLENAESNLKKKEAENKELLLKNVRLEASLEDIRNENKR